MFRILLLFFFTYNFLFSLELTNEEKSSLEKEFFTIYLNSWEPFIIYENSDVLGLSIDIWKELIKDSNIKYEFTKKENFVESLDSIKNNTNGVALSTSSTKDREDYAVFSKPFASFPIAIATHNKESFLVNLKELEGKKVAVGKNYTAYYLLQNNFPKIKFVLVNNTLEALNLLANNKVYAAADILPVLTYTMNKYYFTDLKISGTSKFNFEVKLMLNKENKDLIPIFNKLIDSINSDRKQEILNKWTYSKQIVTINYTYLYWLISFSLFVFIAMFLREKTLKESKKIVEDERFKYQTLMNLASDMIFILDFDGNLVEYSKQVQIQLGYSDEEMKTLNVRNWTKHISKEDFYNVSKNFSNKPYKFQTIHTRKDGTTYNADISAVKIKIYDKEFIHASVRDITEQIQLTQMLKDSEFRWKFAVEESGDGLWDWDISKNKIFFSSQCKIMLGFQSDEIDNNINEWITRIHPEYKERVLKEFDLTLKGKIKILHTEYPLLCKNGEYKWILERGIVVQRDGNNNPLRMIGTNTDINELKTMQKDLEKINEKFSSIFNHSLDAIALVNLETELFEEVNPVAVKMYGYTKEEFAKLKPIDLDGQYDQKQIDKIHKEIKEKGFSIFETKSKFKDGTIIDVLIYSNLFMMYEKPYLHTTIRDITSQKEIERKIKEYISIMDKHVLVSTTDLKGVITSASKAFCDLSGYTQEELIGSNHSILRHPDTPKEIYKSLWETITQDKTWVGEIKNKKENGDSYWISTTIEAIFDKFGVKSGYTSIKHDITDKKQIEIISITDGLTQIFNRRYFDELFPKFINSAKRENELISFIIMDIDHFKQYNDTYGHQEGDNVLIQVADTIKNSLNRVEDYCFRLGGEEFGVLYKSESKQKALEFANSIRQNIENLEIVHEKNSASSYITVSMGLICKEATQIKVESIYKEADKLLYKAKEFGRNQVSSN